MFIFNLVVFGSGAQRKGKILKVRVVAMFRNEYAGASLQGMSICIIRIRFAF